MTAMRVYARSIQRNLLVNCHSQQRIFLYHAVIELTDGQHYVLRASFGNPEFRSSSTSLKCSDSSTDSERGYCDSPYYFFGNLRHWYDPSCSLISRRIYKALNIFYVVCCTLGEISNSAISSKQIQLPPVSAFRCSSG